MTDGTTVFERIMSLLEQSGCAFECIEHAPISTALEAATVRGTPLEQGAKSILFKLDRDFVLLAMSAGEAVRSAKLRTFLGIRRTRFATVDELAELTGLEPGAVPPFGEPVLPFPLYADPSLLKNEELYFTAGSRQRSIRLATDDYRRVAKPQLLEFVR